MPLTKSMFYSVLAAGVSLFSASAWANPPTIVATIAPVHSLAAAVAEGRAEPVLLVPAAQSPHDFALRPSNARALSDADVLFWIGPDLEQFMTAAVDILPSTAQSVELSETEGLTRYDFRSGGVWEAHDHSHGDDHDHDHAAHEDEHDHDHSNDEHDHASHQDDHDHDHDHAAHEDDHDHNHDHAAHEEEHDHGNDHDHSHGDTDPHFWLDPMNAATMALKMASVLSEVDPEGADLYQENAQRLRQSLSLLNAELTDSLAAMDGQPFIVFHDAFQYFERRYNLAGVGAVTVSPDQLPGARRLAEIREIVRDRGAVCVFSEPQFNPRIVNALIEGTDVRTAVLDPLGQGIEVGAGLYPQLLRNMANSAASCLLG